MIILAALAIAAFVMFAALCFAYSRCTDPAIVGDRDAWQNRRAARARQHKRDMKARAARHENNMARIRARLM